MNYPENIEEIKKFAKEINLDVKYLFGEKWEWDLNLCYVKSLPANIVFNISGYLDLDHVISFPPNIEFNVDGWLDLLSVETLPKNTVFNVGKNLWLPKIKSVSSDVVFNVGGSIYLNVDHKVKVLWD